MYEQATSASAERPLPGGRVADVLNWQPTNLRLCELIREPAEETPSSSPTETR